MITARADAQAILPQGGTVASGQVRIGTPTGNTLTINQSSSKAIVDWNSFSVGANASVNIVQPNSGAAILNRVTGTTPSTIAGQINANGQVFLVNPNGIAITPTGSVQVGGGFVASTLDIGNADFNAGKLNFAGKGASAAVSNAGHISGASGSFVGLIGGSVSNSGSISVPLGKVGLGAGEKVTLDPTGDGFLQVALPTGATAADGKALIDVSGRIRATGGSVEIKAATAQQAVRDVVNVSGSISARSVRGRSGNIVLGSGSGTVTVSGTLAANGGRRAKGGTVVVTGSKVALTSTAKVTANGSSGGSVLIGGDLRGGIDPLAKLVNAPVRTAQTTSIAQGAMISANGTSTDGGNVVVWSDTLTDFRGSITATGGSGKGGAAEVSSHGVLGFRGGVDVTATSGNTGTLLLDPFDVTISAGSDTNISNFANIYSPTGNSSNLSATTLQNALATANVTVITGFSGAQSGNITVADALTWNSGNSLALNAAGAIAINAPITASSGALTLSAGSPAAAITATAAISVGSLTISQGAWSQNTANLPGLYAGSFSIGSNASFLRAAGGSGTGPSPYLLTDIYGVQGAGSSAAYLSSSYKLANDVDASVTSAWNGGLGFNPIGTTGGAYSGTFDGGNYAVSNLLINRGSSDRVGLFGYISGATIQNLYLLNANVTGGSIGGLAHGSGTLVGVADNFSLIQNVVVTGAMTGSAAGGGTDCCIGGIVGVLNNASVLRNSSAAVNVTSAIGRVGGAVGSLEALGAVQGVSASGNVSAPGQQYVGGLVGSTTSDISNSYATGAVFGGINVGGLLGYAANGTISNSYSTGAVTGGFGFAGGFAGGSAGIANFTNDYWNTQTSGQAFDGFGVSGTTGLTTAQMLLQASFVGFDFAGTWYQTAGYYPTLRGTTTILGAAPGATGGDLTISSAADTVLTSATTTTNINTTSLQNLLGVGNVLVSTTSGTLGVNNDVTWGSSSLRLASSGALTIGANLTSGSGGNLGLTSSAISINGSSISLGGALTATAAASGAGTAIDLTNATISVGSGSSVINGTSSTGKGLDIFGGVSLAAGGGGTLTASGTNTGATSTAATQLETNASVTSAGTVSLSGTSSSGTGLLLNGGTALTASSGNLAVNGISTSGQGVTFVGANAVTNGGAGTLTLSGTSSSLHGTQLDLSASLTTSGNVTIAGASTSSVGLYLVGSNAITDSFGTATFSGSSQTNQGIWFNGGSNTLTAAGAATLALTGSSTSSGGIALNSSTDLTTSGTVGLSGASTSSTGLLFNGSNAITESSGSLTLGGTSGSGIGVWFFSGASTLTANGTGIGITGSGSSNIGVALNSDLTTSGPVSIAGTSTTGNGLWFLGTTITDSSGALSLSGTSTSSNAVWLNGNNALSLVNSGGGSYTLSGSSGSLNGVRMNTSAALQTSGDITISGTSTSGSGVSAKGGNALAISSGNLTINGTTSTGSAGIDTSSAGNTITNSGSGTFTLNGTGGDLLAATIASSSGNLVISDTGAVTQSGGTVTAGNLLLSGAGSFALGQTNMVGTLAANVGSVSFVNGQNLAIGTVQATSGITATGAATVQTSGNLTLASGAPVSAASPVLSAAGAFINNAGSGSVTATSGRWLIYSNAPGSDTFGGLDSGNTAIWNATYAGLPPGSVSASGNRYLFAFQPTLTFTSTNASKTYGTDAAAAIASNYGVAGYQGGVSNAFLGDNASSTFTGSPAAVTSTGAAATASVAGSPYAMTIAQGSLAATSGYALAFNSSGTLTINPAPVTVTALGGSSTYGASPANPGLSATGLQNGESVNVLTGLSNTFGITSASNAGSYVLSVIGTLTNSNYTVAGTNTGSWTVNPASVTVTALGGSSTYGSSPANPGLSATGLQNGQNVSALTGLSNSFGIINTTNAGSYVLSVIGTLTNANYTVAGTNTGNWTVNPAPVTVTALGGASTYGASPANPGLSATGLQNGQSASVLTGLSNSFGISNATNAGSYVLSVIGVLTNGNYTLAGTSNGSWTVNPAPVTVTALGGSSTVGSSPSNPGLSATGLQNGQSASVLTGLSNSFGITNTSPIGSYLMSVVGTLTNGNYTVVGTNSGSWSVTALRGSMSGGTPTFNGPSPSDPNLLFAPPSGSGGNGVLSGLATSSSTAIGGAAAGGKSSGAGSKNSSVNPSGLVGTPGPASPPASPPQSNLFAAPSAPAPVSAPPAGSANAGTALQGGCGGKAGAADAGGCAAQSPPKKAADVMDFVLSRLNRDALAQAIGEQFSDIARSESTPRRVLMISFASTGVALTVGFVGWLLRGGALASAFLSSMPLWRGFDPLVIMQRPRRNGGGRRIISRLDTLFDSAGAVNKSAGRLRA